MSETQPHRPPYQELHIYYLKGRVGPTEALRGSETFIGNWEEEGDAFLFFSQPADAVVHALLKRRPQLTLVDTYQMGYDEWQGGAVEPLSVGDLHIAAPWQVSEAAAADNPILLDPGVVFGTGSHPTTHDCLTALQLAFQRETVASAVDLGTGTGLLALAAAHLGAARVVAVDTNALAAETALKNVRLNRMADRIVVVQGNAKNFIDLACDLMISNIHYAVMRELVETPGFLAHKQYVLSGLLRSQAREIEGVLRRRSTILRTWERNGIWTTFWGASTGG
jgi:ribosomal protein L11 methyltransferase